MRQSAATAACAELSYPFGAWSLDIWEGFFQADTGGTPVLRALRPEGPRELSPGFSLGRFHPHDGKPCRGGGMEECLPISINPKHNVRRNRRDTLKYRNTILGIERGADALARRGRWLCEFYLA